MTRLEPSGGQVRRGPARRPRIAWVTQEIPDRNLSGGNIRQAHLIHQLSNSFDVHLFVLGAVTDPIVKESAVSVNEIEAASNTSAFFASPWVQRILSLWILVRRQSRAVFLSRHERRQLSNIVLKATVDMDLVVVNHFELAPLVPKRRALPWIFHPHNVHSARSRQAERAGISRRQRWLFGREASIEERLERWSVSAYDGIVVVSTEDARLLTAHKDPRVERPILVVPNGVDTDAFAPTPLPREPRLLFSGSLSYGPNRDAMIWFCHEVLPLIRRQIPAVSLDIVGRGPTPDVMALSGQAGVAVHADVPTIHPWFRKARVMVIPIRIGTGTRLKALEAFAAGRPVVGTAIGLDGLGLVDGIHARITDSPEMMAEAVVDLLRSDESAAPLIEAARRLVEEKYRWESVGRTFAVELESRFLRGSATPE